VTDSQPEFLTVAQAAALFQVSHATVRRWLEEGTLPGLKISRHWRIHRPRLLAALDRRSTPGEPAIDATEPAAEARFVSTETRRTSVAAPRGRH
jgi:excisionase family DNA binding protein